MVRRAVVVARGHPNIRATHDKTLELTVDADITERATCVLGVTAEVPPELALLRGRVQVALTVGQSTVTGEATMNPSREGGLVIRRGDHRDGSTLAIRSTLTARSVDRELAAALTDPTASVTLTLTETEDPPPLVVVEPARWRHADSRLNLATVSGPGPAISGVIAVAGDPSADGARWLRSAAEAGARFLASAVLDEALLAAGWPTEPSVRLGRLDRRDLKRDDIVALLLNAPAPVALWVDGRDAPRVQEMIMASDADRAVAIADGATDVGTGMVRSTAAAADWTADRDEALIVLGPPRTGGSGPGLGAVVRALSAAGVPPRTVVEALKPLGVTRQRVYEALNGPAET